MILLVYQHSLHLVRVSFATPNAIQSNNLGNPFSCIKHITGRILQIGISDNHFSQECSLIFKDFCQLFKERVPKGHGQLFELFDQTRDFFDLMAGFFSNSMVFDSEFRVKLINSCCITHDSIHSLVLPFLSCMTCINRYHNNCVLFLKTLIPQVNQDCVTVITSWMIKCASKTERRLMSSVDEFKPMELQLFCIDALGTFFSNSPQARSLLLARLDTTHYSLQVRICRCLSFISFNFNGKRFASAHSELYCSSVNADPFGYFLIELKNYCEYPHKVINMIEIRGFGLWGFYLSKHLFQECEMMKTHPVRYRIINQFTLQLLKIFPCNDEKIGLLVTIVIWGVLVGSKSDCAPDFTRTSESGVVPPADNSVILSCLQCLKLIALCSVESVQMCFISLISDLIGYGTKIPTKVEYRSLKKLYDIIRSMVHCSSLVTNKIESLLDHGKRYHTICFLEKGYDLLESAHTPQGTLSVTNFIGDEPSCAPLLLKYANRVEKYPAESTGKSAHTVNRKYSSLSSIAGTPFKKPDCIEPTKSHISNLEIPKDSGGPFEPMDRISYTSEIDSPFGNGFLKEARDLLITLEKGDYNDWNQLNLEQSGEQLDMKTVNEINHQLLHDELPKIAHIAPANRTHNDAQISEEAEPQKNHSDSNGLKETVFHEMTMPRLLDNNSVVNEIHEPSAALDEQQLQLKDLEVEEKLNFEQLFGNVSLHSFQNSISTISYASEIQQKNSEHFEERSISVSITDSEISNSNPSRYREDIQNANISHDGIQSVHYSLLDSYLYTSVIPFATPLLSEKTQKVINALLDHMIFSSLKNDINYLHIYSEGLLCGNFKSTPHNMPESDTSEHRISECLHPSLKSVFLLDPSLFIELLQDWELPKMSLLEDDNRRVFEWLRGLTSLHRHLIPLSKSILKLEQRMKTGITIAQTLVLVKDKVTIIKLTHGVSDQYQKMNRVAAVPAIDNNTSWIKESMISLSLGIIEWMKLLL
jgi:hypothetical protein